MEGVDHVHVVQVRRSGLIGQVHRMVQRHIPDGEGLEFGIARCNAPLVLMVQLAQAGGQLAAAGAGGRHHHQGPRRFDIVILAKALGADHEGGIGGVALNGIVVVNLDAHTLQTGLEGLCHGVVVIPGEHNAGDVESKIPEDIDQPNHVQVIGNAQIAPDLVLFDVAGVDGNDHLHVVLQLQKHPQLAVGLKAGKHPGCVIVVIELAAKLQVQLAAKLSNALPDMLRLHLQIFIVVKRLVNHDSRLFQVKINHATL